MPAGSAATQGAGLGAERVAEVNEADARALCLLRACEEGAADAALWSPEDAAWASRLADETVAAGAPALAWLAERARHAQQRLLPRRVGLARQFARRAWRAGGLRWVGAAAFAGLALGFVADVLGGGGQRIDLLATPAWALVAWNVAVVLVLAWAALRGAGAGPMRRAAQRWLGGAGGLGRAGTAGGPSAAASEATPEQRFAALWARTFAPVLAARAAMLLHVAALALAVGLVAGMYARALVLDYRPGWQSTLLTPTHVHEVLALALAPASALTGLAVPGVDEVAALRHDGAGQPWPGATAPTREQATRWLHLLAATLGWAVGLPRLLLAALAAGQAARRARHLRWPVDDIYALTLLRGRRGGAAGHAAVSVCPHGFSPSPAATLALRTWLADWGGESLQLQMRPTIVYGEEDKVAAAMMASAAASKAACVVWVELAATPEPQVQGRLLGELRAASHGAALALLVDESSYRQRLGAGSPRLAERRRAWQALADEAGVGLVCVDLLQPAAGSSARGLDAAFAATQRTPGGGGA